MAQTSTARGDLFARVLDPANRHNPYPLYAALRETPVALQDDGTYVVSTYQAITTLLHDPRISSDERKSERGLGAMGRSAPEERERQPSFLALDPPDHDRLRRKVMRQFTPARVAGMSKRVVQLVRELLTVQRGHRQLDVVHDLAYPLPVTVICELLGVPREDEPRFHVWATTLASILDPAQSTSEEQVRQIAQASEQLREYLTGLIAARRARPEDDLLSGLVVGDDPEERMNEPQLVSTMGLLLIAGHETTVNLITNGMLTLLRHPDVLERLRHAPELVVTLVEEVLRYDPPVQFRTRTTLTEIEIAGVTIPQGATVALLLASGSRDPLRFPDADRFVPTRADNQHLGFGGGIHYCVGAPLARLEAQVALSELVRRLIAPRLIADPPPYRDNAALRGPEQLLVAFDQLTD